MALISRQRGMFISVFALASLAASAGQCANFLAQTTAASGTIQTPGVTDNKNVSGAAPVSATSSSSVDSSSDQFARGSSYSSASAEAGAVHAYSSATGETFGVNCCTSGGGSASSTGQFSDLFFLSSGDIAAGTKATITATVYVDGAFLSDQSGVAWSGSEWWRASAYTGDTPFSVSGSRNGSSGGGFSESGASFGAYTITFGAFFGQNNLMQMTVETEAFASAGGPGLNFSSFATDLGDTFAWGGIQKVMVDGTEVTDFSALSADTGFDYRYAYVEPGSGAVPEPATWALMLTGFGLGGTMLRSRRVPRRQTA